jgi:tripartite-type tricarboxylate transporter receptor subunit TctC
MNRIARSLLTLALVASVCGAMPIHAQDKPTEYPRRPIRIVIGIAPGGGLDTMTRIAAQKLSERFGQTAVVDNRPGGGTVLGMDLVAQASPDGYTLLGASETLMLNGVFKRAKYDVRKAFVPIVQLTTQPYVLVVNPSLPITSVKELIAYAKAKPGALRYGTPGVGTTLHIGWERLSAMAGVEFLHVPYRGAVPALVDLMSGQIQMTISTTVTIGPHLKAGKVRVLAATGPKRVSVYPDLPTVSEAGLPGYELTNSYAFFAPALTPRMIIGTINAAAIDGMNSPDILKVLAADGAEVAPPATPEEFRAKFERDYAELEKVIKAANIKLQ